VSVLADYIKRQMEKGFSLKAIKSKLLEVGHDVDIVEAEIKKLEKEASAFERKEERKIGKWILQVKKMFLRNLPNFSLSRRNRVVMYYFFAAAAVILILIIAIQVAPKLKKDVCLDAANKDNCYARTAMAENNAKSCEKITNLGIKDACTQELWRINECVYMQRTGFEQSEIEECQRKAFIRSLG
jgi:SOS response regulatory protein OraA/RecX